MTERREATLNHVTTQTDQAQILVNPGCFGTCKCDNKTQLGVHILLVYFPFKQAFIQDRFSYISIMSKHMFRLIHPLGHKQIIDW